MKSIKYIFLLLLIILFIQSCDGLVSRKPLTSISSEKISKDVDLAKAYLTDLYSQLPFWGFYNSSATQLSDIATVSTTNSNAVTQGTASAESPMDAIDYWHYEFIRDCYKFLKIINNSDFEDQVKKNFKGQVMVMIAWSYFEMQKRYGGVPLVDKMINPFAPKSEYKEYTKRSTEEEIAGFIQSTLNKAVSLLPENPKPKGKINKWVALAFKARAALWSASIAKFGEVRLNGLVGIPSSRTKEFYKKAINAANAVIQSNNYELYNKYPNDKSKNYRHIFVDENNSEVIFQKVYDEANISQSWDGSTAPAQFDGGAHLNPTLEFILRYENKDGSLSDPAFGPHHLYPNGDALFKNKDPRLFATLFLQGDVWGGAVVQVYEGIDTTQASPNPDNILTGYNSFYRGMHASAESSRLINSDDLSPNSGFILKKYIDESSIIAEQPGGTNWIEIRLAEMYLIKAESAFELGNKAKAVKALNQTRIRAGLKSVTANQITRKKIHRERTSELAFEKFRFWDLRRWRIADKILNNRFHGLRIIYHYSSNKYYFLKMYCEPFTRAFFHRMYYNPFSVDRINENPNLIQNPGY